MIPSGGAQGVKYGGMIRQTVCVDGVVLVGVIDTKFCIGTYLSMSTARTEISRTTGNARARLDTVDSV